ncbi:Cytokine receptor [Pseudolycoriella hygida]|uniref:Cytokine receptor n=1 Tax=Pseudolycoriella hygida TaxID=35572 RepID=A0A9Q0S5H2_9DIPT|nr:Cytokine receptor [Pseudolycoriella hygida]
MHKNVLFLLVTAFVFHQCNGFGRTYPNGVIYREANSTIKIKCIIDLDKPESEGLNSSYLVFKLTHSEQTEPNEEVRILDATSIELTIPNVQPQELVATCYLNNTSGVDMTRVYVGYKPKPVLNFKCISYNWQSMKCSFQRSSNPVASRYELTYSIDNKSLQTNRCPLNGDYNRTFWCTLDFNNLKAVYRQNYANYYFTLTSTNDLGVLTERFTIDHYGAVIPDPVEKLEIKNITTYSALVQWNIPYQLKTFPRNLIHLVNYTSEFSNGVWNQLYISSHEQLTNEILLKSLEFANVWYDVRVSIKVQNASYEGMWSNFTSTTFRTLSRIPDEPPKVDASGFNVDDNGNIYLYWNELPVSKKNGNNLTYNITIERGAPRNIRPNITTNTMAKFDRMTSYMDNDLIFHIRSSNDDGNSKVASVIVVPKLQDRLKHPVQLKKILHDRIYHLSWKAPADSDDIVSYTIFWCATKNEFLNQCDGSINYERVSSHVTNFTHSSNETLNFAIASNSRVSSSGMVWARCTAGSINDIGKLSTIWITKTESTSIEFKWTLECVDQTIVNGFNLTYCPIKDPKTEDCKENTERYINITKSDSLGYKLTNLTPYTTYKTVISMYSSQRASPGPPSEPLINTTYEAAPSPPRNLEFSNVTDTSVTLHWDVPEHINGVLRKYKVWYNKHFKEVDKQHLTPNMTYTLTGLKSYAEYDILVMACTVDDSMGSNTVKIKTDVGIPGNLTLPTMLDDDDELSVTWDPPVTPNGQVQYYEVEVVNKIGDVEKEYVTSDIRGNRCTYNLKKCDVGVDKHSFRVRAVNVVNSPFEPQRIYHHEFDSGVRVCKEANNHRDVTYVDQHATILRGNWSSPMQIYCNQSQYANSGWYILWAFISILGCMVAFVSFLMMKKFKKMKDIGVELPAGLEDIKEEANTKGLTLDYNISPRQDNITSNMYASVPNEQQQSLLRNRMESGSSRGTNHADGRCECNEAIDDSESEPQNDDDSTAQTISENLNLTKSSPTLLIPIPKTSPLKIDPMIVPTSSYRSNMLSAISNNYATEELLRSSPVVAKILTTNGYVSHDAVARPTTTGYTSWAAATSRPFVQTIDETKDKTPVIASTDIQGISGYVTHKQLSDFGLLIQ